jgi:hypothetical protein
MEVKLSISSSRRISFASDLKNIDEYDLELEELENERDNPTGKFQKRDDFTFTNENGEREDNVDDDDYVNRMRKIIVLVKKGDDVD